MGDKTIVDHNLLLGKLDDYGIGKRSCPVIMRLLITRRLPRKYDQFQPFYTLYISARRYNHIKSQSVALTPDEVGSLFPTNRVKSIIDIWKRYDNHYIDGVLVKPVSTLTLYNLCHHFRLTFNPFKTFEYIDLQSHDVTSIPVMKG
jgi:hypothetical protein